MDLAQQHPHLLDDLRMLGDDILRFADVLGKVVQLAARSISWGMFWPKPGSGFSWKRRGARSQPPAVDDFLHEIVRDVIILIRGLEADP